MKIRDGLTGLVALGASAAVIVVGIGLSPRDTESSRAQSFDPAAASLQMVCLGGVTSTVEAGTNAQDVEQRVEGSASVTAIDAPELSWSPFGASEATVISGSLAPGLAGTTSFGAPEYAGTVTVESAGEGAKIAGVATHRGVSGDMRGLAVSPCQWSGNSAWLVGSSTELGSYNRLTIANPGLTPVTVTVAGYSSIGALDLGANSTVTIAPNESTVVNLDGLVANDPRIALHLSADSGRFAATLQTNALDGFTPAGVDIVTPSASATSVMIPGVVIPASQSQGADEASTALADESTAAAVRVVNPSDSEASVVIHTLSAAGQEVLPGGENLSIAPASVVDISLDGLAPGDYAIEVTSAQDISASVVTSAQGGAGVDYAWLPATTGLSSGGAALTANEARLVVASADRAAVQWTAYGDDDAILDSGSLEVSGASGVDLPEGTSFVWVSSQTPIHAAVSLRDELADGDGVAAVALTAAVAETGKVTVAVQP